MMAPTTICRIAGHGLRPPPRGPLRHSSSPRTSSASLPADRRGRLRNGAEPGDFLAAPRCGAHTRAGGCCRQPAMKNDRCRMHGGLSTGPRTPEGRARCARARLKHGFYSAEMVALRRAGASLCRTMDALVAAVRARRTAGHGVLRSNSAIVGAPPCGRPIVGTKGRPRGAAPTSMRVHLRPSAAELSSTAGHGVLPSISVSRLSPYAARLLAGTTLRTPFSAGHGVLRSFSPAGPVPAGMVGQPARQFVAAAVRW